MLNVVLKNWHIDCVNESQKQNINPKKEVSNVKPFTLRQARKRAQSA
jgi:hypothetical protein